MPVNFCKLSYYFDPLLSDESQVITKLSNFKPETAIRFDKFLYFYDSTGNFNKIDISEEKEEKFISNISLDDAQSKLDEQLNKYSSYLGEISKYSLDILEKGSSINLGDEMDDKIATFVTTKKIGTYFDYSIYIFDKNINFLDRVTYRSKQYNYEVKHSGDIGDLLHYVKLNCNPSNYYLLTVTGYNKTPLKNFSNQLPSVIGVNHQNKNLYMIPCSLAEADVGNSCFSVLGIITKKDTKLNLYSCEKNFNVNNVNTGDTSEILIEECKKSIHEFIENSTGGEINKVLLPENEIISTENHKKEFQPIANKFIASQTETYPSIILDTAQYINFGRGLFFSDNPETNSSKVSLPILFGEVSGCSALALGQQSNINMTQESYHKYLNNVDFGLIYLNDDWKETIIKTVQYCFNGIFIIKSSNIEGTPFDIMNKINRGGTVQAGPNAIVLVEIGSKLYFYRGVRIPFLLEELPSFSAEVTNNFTKERIEQFIEMGGFKMLPWDNLNHVKYEYIFYQDKKMKLDEFLEVIKSFNITDIKNNQFDIVDVFTQLSVIMEPSDLEKFVGSVRISLDEVITKEKKQFSDQILEAVGNKKKLGHLVGKMRNISKQIKPLISSLGSIISQKASSSYQADLKRQIRSSKINKNVTNVNKMGLEQITEYIEGIENWAFFGVNSDAIKPALELTSKDKLLETVSKHEYLELTYPHDTCLMLDNITTAILVEAGSRSKNHPLTSSKTLSIPYSLSEKNISAIPFPLLEKYIEMKSPTEYFWIDETNLPEVSTWRILFRSTIVNSLAGREYSISPASKELTFLIIKIILDSIEKLYNSLSSKPDYDNTSAEIFRGLFGLLFTTMASGKTPACLVFQIIYPDSKLQIPPKEQLWMIPKIIKMFSYTGWDDSVIKENAKKLFVRIIRKYITDPINEPRRKLIKHTKKQDQEKYKQARRIELRWLFAACKVMKKIKNEDTSENREIAKRLINIFSGEIINPKGGTEIIKKFSKFAKDEGKADWEGNSYEHMMEAINNIIIKRNKSHWKVEQDEPIMDTKQINEIVEFIITGINESNKNYKSELETLYSSLSKNDKVTLELTEYQFETNLGLNKTTTLQFLELFDNYEQIKNIIDILMSNWQDVNKSEELAFSVL